jgi:hypothetical protein
MKPNETQPMFHALVDGELVAIYPQPTWQTVDITEWKNSNDGEVLGTISFVAVCSDEELDR